MSIFGIDLNSLYLSADQAPPVAAPTAVAGRWAGRLLRYAQDRCPWALRPDLRATQEPPLPHPPLLWAHIQSATAKAGHKRRHWWQRAWDRWQR